MTSSTSPGSTPVRFTNVESTSAIKSTGCQSFNRPFLRPTAVRTAATITASRCAMIEKLLAYLVPVSQFLVVALGGHYFFVSVIVREQRTPVQMMETITPPSLSVVTVVFDNVKV